MMESLIFLLFLFVNMIITKNQNNLFAGNGLKTFSHIILHNKIIEMDCNTYDDCYDLLCEYIIQPVFLVVTEPYNWNGDCNHLNKTDSRQLIAEFDTYHNDNFDNNYTTETNSDTSLLLCELNKNNNITQIQYFIFNCTL